MSRSRPRGPARRALLRPLGAVLVAVLALPATTTGQMAEHRLDGVFPAGGRAGEAVEVRFVGEGLETVEGLWFDHPGLSADRVEGGEGPPRFRVSIAADTPPGLHDVRAVGPPGVSRPKGFAVGRLPEVVEREPNDRPDQAGPIPINSVVNGRVGEPTDVDWFAFEGEAGRRVLARLEASTLDSPLDAELRLFDADGRELAFALGGIGRDPMIDAVLPADGTYRLEIRDAVYAGSPAHAYRLTLHDGPHVDAIVPRAAEPGTTGAFALLGRNLGGEPTGILLADGRPLERKEVTIAVPDDLAIDPDRPGVGFTASPGGGIRGFWHMHETDRGVAGPVFIAEAIGPVVVEGEPDEEAGAIRVEPPCDVSGDFIAVGDEDHFRFDATKGQVWMIEVVADRVGSPVDPTLLVRRVLEDGSLRDVADADDQDHPATASRFARGTVDPALRFEAPEDGTYQVTVGDLYNAPVPAPNAVYRLVIRPERPDFLLFATPADPARPAGLAVLGGGRAAAYVLAHRLDGHAGAIRVEAEGLPAGVSADPVVIAANQAEAPIVLSAAAGTPAKLGTARLVGRPLGDDGAPTVGPARVAVAGTITRAPPGGRNAPTPARVTRGLVVAVRPGAPLRLSAEPAEVAVTRGSEVALTARVARRGGVTGEVQVTADALPSNVTAAGAKIEAGADSAVVTLKVPENVAPGIYTILLRAGGKVAVPDPDDPAATREATLSEPSNPVTLTVLEK